MTGGAVRWCVTLTRHSSEAGINYHADTVATDTPPLTTSPLNGSVLVLIQFDVCEELRLDRLQQMVSARTVKQPSTKHSVPAYVRYQRPPVVEPLDALVLDSGERLEGEIKYYDYGVVSVVIPIALFGRLGGPCSPC